VYSWTGQTLCSGASSFVVAFLGCVGCCFFHCGTGVTTPSRVKVFSCPYTPAPARGCRGRGGGAKGGAKGHMSSRACHHSVGMSGPGLLTSCLVSSWVSAAGKKNLCVLAWFWTYKLTRHAHCIRWRPLGTVLPCMSHLLHPVLSWGEDGIEWDHRKRG